MALESESGIDVNEGRGARRHVGADRTGEQDRASARATGSSEDEWEVPGFESDVGPPEWVLASVRQWLGLHAQVGEMSGGVVSPGIRTEGVEDTVARKREDDAVSDMKRLLDGELVAHALGRGESVMLLPWGEDGKGRLVWANSTDVRQLGLSDLADFAPREEAASVDMVARGRIIASVALERVPPPALAALLQHIDSFLRRAMQAAKDATAAAERERLAVPAGARGGAGAGGRVSLSVVEIPPSLRTKEVLIFLARKRVADLYESARSRAAQRRAWALGQRVLLRHAAAPRKGPWAEAARAGRRSALVGGGRDDHVIFVAGGRRRMFAVTRHRVLWTVGDLSAVGHVAGERRDGAAAWPHVGNISQHAGDNAEHGSWAGAAESQSKGALTVMELELARVQSVQGGSEGHMYFRSSRGIFRATLCVCVCVCVCIIIN